MKQRNKNRIISVIALAAVAGVFSGVVWAEEAEQETEIAAVEAETENTALDAEYGIATLEIIDGQILPDSGLMYLEQKQVAELPAQILAYARYEIYARYGVLFESPELSGYFGKQSWYFGFMSMEDFPESMLNEYDIANLELLAQQEVLNGYSYELDQPGYNYNVINAYLAGEDVSSYMIMQKPEEEPEAEPEALPEEAEAEPKALPEEETESVLGEEMEEEAEPEALPEEAEPVLEEELEAEAEPEALPEAEPEAALDDHPEPPPATDNGGLNLGGNSDVTEEIWSSVMDDTEVAMQQTQMPAASEYIFPDADSRYLSQSEVDALSLQAICYAKNEIYARHGRKFVSRELQEYFGSKSWYNGTIDPAAFSDSVFNDFELQNVQILVGTELSINPAGYPLDQPGYDIHPVGTASASDVFAAMAGTVASDEVYLSRDYIFADSDMRQLTESEVNGLSATVVSYAVNEIYARRGCIFESQQVQQFFEQKSWYSGRIAQAAFSQGLFNQIEIYNINLLLQRRSALMS